MIKIKNTNDFIEHQNKEKTTLVKWVVDRSYNTGKSLDYIINSPKEELENIIIDMKPSNVKMVTNFLYVFGLYAKYTDNQRAIETISHLDRKEIWEKYKSKGNVLNRFISNKEFEDLIFNIEMMEELNTLYYSSLLRCIYNGIYCDDLSVIKNLRGSDIDINTSIVTLRRDDGIVYDLKIPYDLSEDLITLSSIVKWERKNRYGVFVIDMDGIFPDSCFKVETRGDGLNYRYSYFARIRKVSSEYLERPLKPMNIFVSGLMYRIQENLNKENQNPKFAFTNHTRTSYPVIHDELLRCRYDRDVKYFRQMVSGHLDEFGII